MADQRPPREPGEDPVAYGNRCLRAQGRFDVRWRYKPGGGGMELEHTTLSRNPDFAPSKLL